MLEQMILTDIARQTPHHIPPPPMSAWRREFRMMNSVLNQMDKMSTMMDQSLRDYVQRRTDNILALLRRTK